MSDPRPCRGDLYKPAPVEGWMRDLCVSCERQAGLHGEKCLGVGGWRIFGPVAVEVVRERADVPWSAWLDGVLRKGHAFKAEED